MGASAGNAEGGVADDDVVEDFDFEELAGADEFAGETDVAFGGHGVAAGVIVGEDDGRSIGDDGGAEDLPGMDEEGVEGAGGADMDPDEAAAGGQEEDVEGLGLPREGRPVDELGEGASWRTGTRSTATRMLEIPRRERRSRGLVKVRVFIGGW